MAPWVDWADELISALYFFSILVALCGGGVWLYSETCRTELSDYVAFQKGHNCHGAMAPLPRMSVVVLRALGRLYPLLGALEREHDVVIHGDSYYDYMLSCRPMM